MRLKVLNPDNTGLTKEMISLREARMKSIARSDTEVSMEVQSKTKICVDCALDEAVTSLELIEKAVKAEKDGFDVIGLYCSGDPAIEAIREAVSIPVIGAGQTSLQIAIGLGKKFSWITSAQSTVSADDYIRRSGVDYSRLASIHTVPVDIATAGGQDQAGCDQGRQPRACGSGRHHRTSEAKSASRERSPRRRVTWALCGHGLKRSTA